MKNRESEMIREALERFRHSSRVISVVFTVCAAFFVVFLAIAMFALIWPGTSDPTAFVGVVSAIVQNAIAVIAFVLSALFSRDVSRGQTPFTKKQIKRMRIIAWLLLAYLLFYAVWSPIAYPVALASAPLDVVVSPAVEPTGLQINVGALLASCAFFLFSFILDYGRTLQQLSDESM